MTPPSSSGIYLVRFPDHYKLGLSGCLTRRVSQHWQAGAELVCWVEVPNSLLERTEEGLLSQTHTLLRDGVEFAERFSLTDVQVARLQHRMMRWQRAYKLGSDQWFSRFLKWTGKTAEELLSEMDPGQALDLTTGPRHTTAHLEGATHD